MNNLTDLKAYLASLGVGEQAIAKVLGHNTISNIDLIKQKFADYQTLLQTDTRTVIKMVTDFVYLLDYDVMSDSPTSIKNKIKAYQTLLQTDARTMTKIFIANPNLLYHNVTGDGPTAIKNKIKAYQTLLQTDTRTVIKMVTAYPAMLTFDVTGDGPTAIKSKLKNYQELLGVDAPTIRKMVTKCPFVLCHSAATNQARIKDYQTLLQADKQTVTKMMVACPALLNLDVLGDSPTSIKNKINKLATVAPRDQVCTWVVETPNILGVPAQAFKIRYLLAANLDLTPLFLQRGFITNQNKVWARACHLHQHPGVFKMRNVYVDEKTFQQRFGVPSADLMQQHPLDQMAVNHLEQGYLAKTGTRLTLDAQERNYLGLTR